MRYWVEFDHAAEHESGKSSTPSIHTPSSHLPAWFSSILGMSIPRVYLMFLNAFRKFVNSDL